MSTYTAPTINNGDSFAVSTLNTALGQGATGLGEAINSAINVQNISAGSVLKARHMQPGAASRVWEAKSVPGDFETFSVVLSGEPFGEHTNIYAPPDCAVRLTTTATADLEVSAFVDLQKFKHSWASIASFALDLTATLLVNDTTLRSVRVVWSVTTSALDRSVPLRLDGLSASLGAGTYDVWLKLDFTGSTGAGGTVPDIVQCYSLGRGIRAEAFYT